MRAILIYKPVSEHGRSVEEFLRDYTKQTNKKIDVIDPESRDGSDFCEAYDIVQYPSIVALDDGGSVIQRWSGLPLPTISEVSYYDQ